MSDPSGPAHALMERVNRAAVLDAPAKKVAATVRGAIGPGRFKDVLSGTYVGHAVHPVLTDVVIGTWTSALLLDLAGGKRSHQAADRLLAAGVAAYPPTALTGITDWSDSEPADDGVRRVGALHATVNGTAFALQIASLAARRRGDRGRGIALSLAGNGLLSVGGWLGGHMSFAQGVGVDQTTFDPGPKEWTVALPVAELRDGEPVAVPVGDTPCSSSAPRGACARSTTAARTAAARWPTAASTATSSSASATAAASGSPTAASSAARRPARSRRTRCASARAGSRCACGAEPRTRSGTRERLVRGSAGRRPGTTGP
jgi:uncharacterized membrane protein